MEKQERNKHAEKKKKGQKEKEEERERERSKVCRSQQWPLFYPEELCHFCKKSKKLRVITHRKIAEFGTALYFKHYHTSQIDECYHQMPLMERHFTDTLNST